MSKPIKVLLMIYFSMSLMSEELYSQSREERLVPILSRPVQIESGKPYALLLKDSSIAIFVVTPDPVLPWRSCVISGWKFKNMGYFAEMQNANSFPSEVVVGLGKENGGFETSHFSIDEHMKVVCRCFDIYFEVSTKGFNSGEIRFNADQVGAIAKTRFDGAHLMVGKMIVLEDVNFNADWLTKTVREQK